MTDNTIQITPFLHVGDVAAAVRFFVEVLGFRASVADDRYAYVELDGAGVRIQGHGDAAELGRPHGGFGCYIDVRDLAVVEARIGPALANLPKGDVHGPVDQRYGQRELMIRTPDGNLVVFGQALNR